MVWVLIFLAVVFAYLNGLRDSSSILAGVISSRSLPPRYALVLCGLAELIAPFLFGVAVAKSVATGLVNLQDVSLGTITAAMLSALAWTLFTWWRGIPSSSSHALVGGILGSALIARGPQSIISSGLVKVVLPLFIAPLIGLIAGYVVMGIILFATQTSTTKVNQVFQRLQIVTMVSLALSHSANDAQKSMGIITLGLLLDGQLSSFDVPFFVVALCAVAIALGASRGDWRLMHTLGNKIYRIRPVNALSSQAASTLVIFTSALLGAPVSTSQVISMALLGSGASERMNKVRWQVGGEMLLTWMLTIPTTMLIAALLTLPTLFFHF